MRLALVIAIAAFGCTSNPTPHPSNDADTRSADSTGGGAFETQDPGDDLGEDNGPDAMVPNVLDGDAVDGEADADAVDEVDADEVDGDQDGAEAEAGD